MPNYDEGMPTHAVRITFTVSMPGFVSDEVMRKLCDMLNDSGMAAVFSAGLAKVEIKPIPQPKPEPKPEEDRAAVDSFLKNLGGAA